MLLASTMYCRQAYDGNNKSVHIFCRCTIAAIYTRSTNNPEAQQCIMWGTSEQQRVLILRVLILSFVVSRIHNDHVAMRRVSKRSSEDATFRVKYHFTLQHQLTFAIPAPSRVGMSKLSYVPTSGHRKCVVALVKVLPALLATQGLASGSSMQI